MIEKIKETAAYIAAKVQVMPKTAIILGTGLGELVDHITDKTEIPYTEIPNFPVSTVEGHQGKLIFGKLGKKDVMAMQGRFHYYEGYTMQQVTFPVRVMQMLGVKTLFVSNAAGGMNPDFAIGDIMIIRDHINLFPEHPLHGRNYKELGVRFPDMSEAYSRRLIAKALEIAEKNHIKVQQGVYVGTQGPTFETPAEYRYFHIIGGCRGHEYGSRSHCRASCRYRSLCRFGDYRFGGRRYCGEMFSRRGAKGSGRSSAQNELYYERTGRTILI